MTIATQSEQRGSEYQVDILESDAPEILLFAGRQTGKSTTAILWADKYDGTVLTPSTEMARQIENRADDIGATVTAQSFSSIELDNFNGEPIVLDEASYIDLSYKDKLTLKSVGRDDGPSRVLYTLTPYPRNTTHLLRRAERPLTDVYRVASTNVPWTNDDVVDGFSDNLSAEEVVTEIKGFLVVDPENASD